MRPPLDCLYAKACGRLRDDANGVALMEFALMLPVFLLMFMTGAELTNYITTRMRVSQLALQIADNTARMGEGSQLSAKTISETDINDVLIGAQLESGGMNLQTNGRVIISDVEPVATPNTTHKYKIVWQRCYGTQVHPSQYRTGDTNLVGIGPNNLVTAQDDNATMYVEVYMKYMPLFNTAIAPSLSFSETASMVVRDRRDLTQIYNNEHAPVAGC